MFTGLNLWVEFITIPFQWIIDDVIFYSLIFDIITNNTVVIIRLKKMVFAVVFWNIQIVFINEIINF